MTTAQGVGYFKFGIVQCIVHNVHALTCTLLNCRCLNKYWRCYRCALRLKKDSGSPNFQLPCKLLLNAMFSCSKGNIAQVH